MPDFRSTEAPQSVSHQMKPDRRPLRLRDERPRSDVLRTNAMIPPPHGFAPAEDSIGNEKNITFLGRELCRSLRQSGPPSCPLWVKSRHMRCTKLCPLYPQKRTCAVRWGMSALGQKRTFRSSYSITSSARAKTAGASGRSSDLAVLRLITNSNLVACSTG